MLYRFLLNLMVVKIPALSVDTCVQVFLPQNKLFLSCFSMEYSLSQRDVQLIQYSLYEILYRLLKRSD